MDGPNCDRRGRVQRITVLFQPASPHPVWLVSAAARRKIGCLLQASVLFAERRSYSHGVCGRHAAVSIGGGALRTLPGNSCRAGGALAGGRMAQAMDAIHTA